MRTRRYTRVDTIRKNVDAMLLQNKDDNDRRCGYVHLYGVGVLAALVAMKRGHDKKYAELAEIAGILHDYVSYERPDTRDHAHVCAPVIRKILEETGEFSPEEIEMITTAVYNHSDKGRRDAEFDEILKDADVMHHWLRNPTEDFPYCEPRTAELITEFGLTV